MATNRRLVDASGPDYYPTPAWGTLALLRAVSFDGYILEPCCGDGAMSEVIKAYGYQVISSDIVDRGYGSAVDFLDIRERHDNIVTNPPFNIAEELLLHALNIANYKVCFLLRTAFLESKRRFYSIFIRTPPTKVLVFSERLSMYPARQEVKGGGTTSYAWFVWDLNVVGAKTTIEWVPPGLKNRSQNG